MAIVTVVTSLEDVEPLVCWGYYFACAQKRNLVITHFPSDSTVLVDTLHAAIDRCREVSSFDAEVIIEVRGAKAGNRVAAVLSEIQESDAELLLLAKHPGDLAKDESERIAPVLFEQAPCATMLIRAAPREKWEVRRILVPAAGGPHAVAALELAEQVVRLTQGEVTALYVEPEASDLATEVGENILRRVLKKARVDQSEFVSSRIELSSDVQQSITRVAENGYDLVLVGASQVGAIRRTLFGTIPSRLIDGKNATAIAVLRSAKPITARIHERFEDWLDCTIPQLERDERIQLFSELQLRSRWSFDFFTLISLSTMIAAFGLVQDSAAVVIGAMLVAPLMTPLLGAGLALVQGNYPLIRTSCASILYGFFTALVLAACVGWIAPLDRLTPELLARGGPTLFDMAVAFLSGIAAAYCVGRPGLSGALPGVAIAAALVPPIATSGIALANGEAGTAQGAALLFATNVVAIILGAAVSLYGGGMRPSKTLKRPQRWAKRATLALLLCAASLCIPLSSVLIGRISVVESGRFTPAAPVQAELRKVLAANESLKLRKIIGIVENKKRVLEITVSSPEVPSKKLLSALAAVARSKLTQPTEIRIAAELEFTSPILPEE